MNRAHTAAAIRRASNLNYRQIDHLARTGVLVPSISRANGKGSRRLYSDVDLRVAEIIGCAKELGLQPSLMRKILDLTREELRSGGASPRFAVIRRDDIVAVRGDELNFDSRIRRRRFRWRCLPMRADRTSPLLNHLQRTTEPCCVIGLGRPAAAHPLDVVEPAALGVQAKLTLWRIGAQRRPALDPASPLFVGSPCGAPLQSWEAANAA